MIYLSNTTDAQTLRIPAVSEKVDGTLTLTLTNTINLGSSEVEYTPVIFLIDSDGAYILDSDGNYVTVEGDEVDTSRLYYVCSVELEDGMPDGEYEYTAEVDGETVSTGLLIIGDRTPIDTEYDNTVTYEQYNS